MSRKSCDKSLAGIPLLLVLLLALPLAARMMPLAGPGPQRCESPVFVELKGDLAWPGVFTACSPLDGSSRSTMTRVLGALMGWAETTEPVYLSSGTTFDVKIEGSKARLSPSEMSPHFKATLGIPIPVNDADSDSLAAVPGIGLKLANRIVLERDRRGGFQRIEELMTVSGIGPSLYKRIRPHLVL